MTHRLDLFERYCLPSVASQSEQNFRWIVLVHPRTPAEFTRRLCGYTHHRHFDICRTSVLGAAAIRRYIRPFHDRPFLISTRLDNDDAIHQSFVADVHDAFHGQAFEWFNFPCGYTYEEAKGGLFLSMQPNNAFISLIEAVDSDCAPRTAFCINHTRASTLGRVVQASGGAPRWLQIVHDNNIYNHVRSRDVGVRWGLRGFNVRPADGV
jgi:hypothetical protein